MQSVTARRAVAFLSCAVLSVVFLAPVGAKKTEKTKKPKPAPCSAQFVVDPTKASPIAGAEGFTLDAVVVSPTSVTINSGCGPDHTKPHYTRHGWKFHAHWGRCGSLRNVSLVATVDPSCKQLQGKLKTGKPRNKVQFNAAISSCGSQAFASTFDGIQQEIFDKHGCTQAVCHGAAKQGGLDLSDGVAYQNLFQVPATESTFDLVQPGDQRRSFLWLKLAAATDPSQLPPGVQVAGAPMPNGLPPLSKDELELVQLWIYSGAPQTGTVGGTQTLLNACLPPPAPIIIAPLDPPPPGTGVQFVMPVWPLPAQSEHELCFATYYDITAQVPKEFQDPTGTMFRFSAQELRQDPQSHHLLLNRYAAEWFQQDPATVVHDPAFGQWTCNGGDKAGQACEPTDLTSCDSGLCTSVMKPDFACIGYGPPAPSGTASPGGGSGTQLGTTFYAIGGAQKAQADETYTTGVFGQVPMRGILFWDSHAFNLTPDDTTMHARLNYYFATQQTYPLQAVFDISKIFAPNAPPYTTQTVCNDHVLPQGARLFELSSHTHKHGKHFSVDPGNGSIYDSFVYNDPADDTFNPPLAFDSPDPAQRTLHYCSLYNNGVATDGSPDPTAVTRASQVPPQGFHCTPTACAAGKVGAPCAGSADDRSCDSAPGANDGSCDACPITGGESTENEMFILIGSYFLNPGGPGVTNGVEDGSQRPELDATGRSTWTELALPPQHACSSMHQGHAGMLAGHEGH
jgi:hypothetical protein